ncbi:hypothetical protein Hdeb2414_s0010g00330301 [Helianthus debilis subsp. tardiflorus]
MSSVNSVQLLFEFYIGRYDSDSASVNRLRLFEILFSILFVRYFTRSRSRNHS